MRLQRKEKLAKASIIIHETSNITYYTLSLQHGRYGPLKVILLYGIKREANYIMGIYHLKHQILVLVNSKTTLNSFVRRVSQTSGDCPTYAAAISKTWFLRSILSHYDVNIVIRDGFNITSS